ncbi:hypothetical protein ACMD2_12933 [Ananas comosus]|uniref:Uncharacterized protein n=1 Tax=Ananas comosus TaxID=4615 RepID=A0A199VAK5_ANACO|nr:hypothetical protein ACMD2_12933 [Ananas comosus]
MELYNMGEKLKKLREEEEEEGNGRGSGRRGRGVSLREGRGRVTAPSFTARCACLVREQRARFYIARRCVTMLLCWRDYP